MSAPRTTLRWPGSAGAGRVPAEAASAPAAAPGGASIALALCAVAALAVLLVVSAIEVRGRSVWIDEMYAFDTATRSLAGTWRRALDFEMQPPLYFLTLHFWLRLDESVEFARVLSAALMVLAVGALALHAHRARLGWAGAALPLLAALHPYVLWAAAEARGYALTFLLLTVSTILWLRLLEDETRSRRLLAAYALVTYLALLNFYYAGFVLLGHGLGALVHRRNAGRVVGALVAVGVAMLPWVPTILAQMRAHPNGNEPLPAAGVAWIGRFVLDAALPSPLLSRPLVAALVAAGLAAAAVATVRMARAADRLPAAASLAFAVPMLVFVLLRTANLFEVQPRYLGVVVPGLLLWIALVVHRARGRLALALAAGVTAVMALSAVSYLRNRGPVQDWRSAVEFVHRHEAAGQPIFLFEAASALPFRHYYRGANPVLGIPRDATLRHYGPGEDRIASAAELEARLPAQGEYWVLLNHFVQGDVGLPLLRAHLRDRAVVVRRDSVRSLEVYQVRARPPGAPGAAARAP